MASLDHPEREERLSHPQQRFREAEPQVVRAKVWKQVRSIGNTGALIALGAALGSGTFLALDLLNPPAKRGEPFLFADTYYQTCRDAFLDGRTNIRRGEQGYRAELDADGDGLACEPFLRR